KLLRGRAAGHATLHRDHAVVINIERLLPHLRPGVADRIHDAPPVWIATKPRAFHQARLGYGFGGTAGLGDTDGAIYVDFHELRHPFAILHDEAREVPRDMIQRPLKAFVIRRAVAQRLVPGQAISERDHGVVRAHVAVDRDPVERLLHGRGERLLEL